MKRILLVCGTGVATSTVVRKRVSDILDARGHKKDYSITQGKVAEVPGQSENYDLCISTVNIDKKNCKCPLIIGTQFLMGINTEPLIAQILQILYNE